MGDRVPAATGSPRPSLDSDRLQTTGEALTLPVSRTCRGKQEGLGHQTGTLQPRGQQDGPCCGVPEGFRMGRGPGAVPHTRSPTWSTWSSRALLANICHPQRQYHHSSTFSGEQTIKKSRLVRSGSGWDENVPRSGAERGENLRAATLRTLEQRRC